MPKMLIKIAMISLVVSLVLMIAFAAAGLQAAAASPVNDAPILVEQSPKTWAVLLSISLGFLILAGIFFSWLFKAGDKIVKAIILRVFTDGQVITAIQAMAAPLVLAHNTQEDAHFKQTTSAFREVDQMIRNHNADDSAHKNALAPYATRDELNGAIDRVMTEMKHGFKFIQRDIHRLDPQKFTDADLVDLEDMDVTGRGKKR